MIRSLAVCPAVEHEIGPGVYLLLFGPAHLALFDLLGSPSLRVPGVRPTGPALLVGERVLALPGLGEGGSRQPAPLGRCQSRHAVRLLG